MCVFVNFKYIQYLFVNYTYIKLKKTKMMGQGVVLDWTGHGRAFLPSESLLCPLSTPPSVPLEPPTQPCVRDSVMKRHLSRIWVVLPAGRVSKHLTVISIVGRGTSVTSRRVQVPRS
jgi:hypothetical protein